MGGIRARALRYLMQRAGVGRRGMVAYIYLDTSPHETYPNPYFTVDNENGVRGWKNAVRDLSQYAVASKVTAYSPSQISDAKGLLSAIRCNGVLTALETGIEGLDALDDGVFDYTDVLILALTPNVGRGLERLKTGIMSRNERYYLGKRIVLRFWPPQSGYAGIISALNGLDIDTVIVHGPRHVAELIRTKVGKGGRVIHFRTNTTPGAYLKQCLGGRYAFLDAKLRFRLPCAVCTNGECGPWHRYIQEINSVIATDIRALPSRYSSWLGTLKPEAQRLNMCVKCVFAQDPSAMATLW